MTRLTIRHALRTALTAAAAAALLAACSSSKSGGGPSTNAPGGGNVLATHAASVGTVLANSSGKTLYTADAEANGTIKCTGDCLKFWLPVTATSASAPAGVTGKIGTTKRPDNNQTQLTYNGAPLYTFADDGSAGDAKGNGFKDAFGGNHFTWHAVIITAAGGGSSSSSPSYSYNSGGGGGY